MLRTSRQTVAKPRTGHLATDKRVAIVRFSTAYSDAPDIQARAEASRISAEQKVKNLSYLGFEVDQVVLPPSVEQAEFSSRIIAFNNDPKNSGIIIQLPIPRKFFRQIELIQPEKDIDALLKDRSSYPACATAEGIVRIVRPFTLDGPEIAVAGSKGFVGSGVVKLLRAQGFAPIELDMGDDLTRVQDSDIVISTTGRPRLLGAQHLRPHHRLVVDAGFIPQPDGRILSEVQREAFDIPQNITPVPGGIGPIEMAVLMERVLDTGPGTSPAPWKYEGRPYKTREELADSPRRLVAAHAVVLARRAEWVAVRHLPALLAQGGTPGQVPTTAFPKVTGIARTVPRKLAVHPGSAAIAQSNRPAALQRLRRVSK